MDITFYLFIFYNMRRLSKNIFFLQLQRKKNHLTINFCVVKVNKCNFYRVMKFLKTPTES